MPAKTASLVSVVLTVLVLLVLAILNLFFEMAAQSSASKKQGLTAPGVPVLCQRAGFMLHDMFE